MQASRAALVNVVVGSDTDSEVNKYFACDVHTNYFVGSVTCGGEEENEEVRRYCVFRCLIVSTCRQLASITERAPSFIYGGPWQSTRGECGCCTCNT